MNHCQHWNHPNLSFIIKDCKWQVNEVINKVHSWWLVSVTICTGKGLSIFTWISQDCRDSTVWFLCRVRQIEVTISSILTSCPGENFDNLLSSRTRSRSGWTQSLAGHSLTCHLLTALKRSSMPTVASSWVTCPETSHMRSSSPSFPSMVSWGRSTSTRMEPMPSSTLWASACDSCIRFLFSYWCTSVIFSWYTN